MNFGDVLFQLFSLLWVFFIIIGTVYLVKFIRKNRLASHKMVHIEEKLDKIIALLEKDKED